MTISIEMPLAELELPYPSGSGNHSVRHGGGRHYLSDGAKAYRIDVERQCNPRGDREPLTGPLRVDWLLAPPDRKARDVDNLFKVVKDALTHAAVWADDSNGVITAGSWRWTNPMPGGAIFLTISRDAH